MTYDIFDGRNTCLLANNSHIVEARTARQALQKYLASQGLGQISFYNTSDNDVLWKTTPFVERDGRRYQHGRISWWGIKPVKIN